jgi:predicted acetyltransferase
MPEYRNRGLIRAIFELIHARSTACGQLAQGITGLTYYYRQFGYEYALDLGGSRSVYLAAIPKLKEGQPEPYALRAATLHDLPQLLALYVMKAECAS